LIDRELNPFVEVFQNLPCARGILFTTRHAAGFHRDRVLPTGEGLDAAVDGDEAIDVVEFRAHSGVRLPDAAGGTVD